MRKLDSKHQLVNYFINNVKKGYTVDSLKFALLRQGYSRTSVEQSLDEANKIMSEKAPVIKESSQATYEITDEPKPRKSFWRWLFG
jgi:hypothetical protein